MPLCFSFKRIKYCKQYSTDISIHEYCKQLNLWKKYELKNHLDSAAGSDNISLARGTAKGSPDPDRMEPTWLRRITASPSTA